MLHVSPWGFEHIVLYLMKIFQKNKKNMEDKDSNELVLKKKGLK
jgi:hypothetical protein